MERYGRTQVLKAKEKAKERKIKGNSTIAKGVDVGNDVAKSK